VAARTSGVIWLVYADEYRTFGSQCGQLRDALARIRGGRTIDQLAGSRYFEREYLVHFPGAPG
jgi:hypothetical protein